MNRSAVVTTITVSPFSMASLPEGMIIFPLRLMQAVSYTHLLRLASLNTPSSLTTALSVIAGIVLSDFAVKSGWFNMQSLLYMAFVSIANYSQPSYELDVYKRQAFGPL